MTAASPRDADKKKKDKTNWYLHVTSGRWVIFFLQKQLKAGGKVLFSFILEKKQLLGPLIGFWLL